MSIEKKYLKTEEWVSDLLGRGRHAFTLKEIRGVFAHQSAVAIKSSLKRMVDKGRIVSIHKGYYLIISSPYKSRGFLPPYLYLDGLMKELGRPYYMGLLNAAAFHGAAHQQPQEFYVVTSFPVLRTTQKKGLKVNYISKVDLPEKLIDVRKTESGYLKISNPILTAIDLVQYVKRVGGLNRVATILYELMESIKPEMLDRYMLRYAPVTTLQRLGYLFERVLNNPSLANVIYRLLEKNKTELFRTPLNVSGPRKGFPIDQRWNVVINAQIEMDF